MAQIVINIPDVTYEFCNRYGYDNDIISQAVKNGILLPKGHGRLIDADGACEGNCAECPVNDICLVNKAPTVIEAYEGAE